MLLQDWINEREWSAAFAAEIFGVPVRTLYSYLPAGSQNRKGDGWAGYGGGLRQAFSRREGGTDIIPRFRGGGNVGAVTRNPQPGAPA